MTTAEHKEKVYSALDDIRKKCYGDLQAEEASRILLAVSSLYGSIIEMSIDAQMEYNRKYAVLTDEFEKVSEARSKAKASREYEEVLRLEGKVEVTKELIGSLKYLLKVKLDEKREAVY